MFPRSIQVGSDDARRVPYASRAQRGAIALLLLSALAPRATAQGDYDARVEAANARVHELEAEIRDVEGAIPGIRAAYRQEVQSRMADIEADIRSLNEEIRDAQDHIQEHTTNCDVVRARRRGEYVSPQSWREHENALFDAQRRKSEAQMLLQRVNSALNVERSKLNLTSPEESAANQRLMQLRRELSMANSQAMSFRSQRATQQAADAFRRSGEELSERLRQREQPRPAPSSNGPYVGWDRQPGRFPMEEEIEPERTTAPSPARGSSDRTVASRGSSSRDFEESSRAPERSAEAQREAARLELLRSAERVLESAPPSTSSPAPNDISSFLDVLPSRETLGDRARVVTRRLADVAGDQKRTPTERFAATMLGTVTQTFTGETTRQEYAASTRQVGERLGQAGAVIGLVPSPATQIIAGQFQALGTGFELGGELLGLKSAADLGSNAVRQKVIDLAGEFVEGPRLSAVLDGLKIASQLEPGEDRDLVEAAFTAFAGMDRALHDDLLRSRLDSLRREATLGGWTREGLHGAMRTELRAHEIHEYLRELPSRASEAAEPVNELLDALRDARGGR